MAVRHHRILPYSHIQIKIQIHQTLFTNMNQSSSNTLSISLFFTDQQPTQQI
ncbi:hypothetical protein Hanom_Chr04g00288051 [Helianthus anomalus]